MNVLVSSGDAYSPSLPPRAEVRNVALQLCEVIGAVGRNDFYHRLAWWFHAAVGVEHLAVFAFNDDVPIEVGAASVDGTDTAHRQAGRYISGGYWRRDPSIFEAHAKIASVEPNVIRLDLDHLGDPELLHEIWGKTRIRERILLCGGSGDNGPILSILRPEHLSEEELLNLRDVASTILALITKHDEIASRDRRLAQAMTSIDEIQLQISGAPERFPRREEEVCTRIIYGLSTAGISYELGIGEETVMTYRKRLYQRLGIATQRELLIWYLRLWSGSSERLN